MHSRRFICPAPGAGGRAAVYFFRTLSVLGETREAFNWISLLSLDCCDFNEIGRSRSGLGYV